MKTRLIAAAALTAAMLTAAPAFASVPRTLACLRDASVKACRVDCAPTSRLCPARRTAIAANGPRPRILTATTMEELGRRQLDQLIASIR